MMRTPSYTAQQSTRVKNALKPLNLTKLHVTSSKSTRSVTITWTDGPPEQAIRKAATGLAWRITYRRQYSPAAIAHTVLHGTTWNTAKAWMANADLTHLDERAAAISELAALLPEAENSLWTATRQVANLTRNVDIAVVELATQLRREGSSEPPLQLIATATALNA